MAAPLPSALSLWLRQELDLPPAAAPPEPLLRRLCLGTGASIWQFITQRVKHPRTVKKIRGNLQWYQHLEEEEGVEPKADGAGLKGALSQLRLELRARERAVGGALEAALGIDAALEAGLAQRGAELQRGVELRQLAAEAVRIRKLLQEGRSLLQPPDRKGVGLGLAALIGSVLEPEVVREVRAVCRIRAQALEELLEPRPAALRQQLMEAANRSWLQAAEEVLSSYSPGAVLWALQQLAEEGRREVCLGLDPAPEHETPPTVKSLLQDSWGVVGELWGQAPPPGPKLRPLEAPPLKQLLGADPKALQAARLALEASGLAGARRALARGVQELRRGPRDPKSQPPLEELGQRLQHGRRGLERRQRHLRALEGATGRLRAQLHHLLGEVRRSGQVPPGMAEEGQRLQQALGSLGALPGPPRGPAPDPLLPISCVLGVAQKSQQGALCQALALRHRLLLGAGLKTAGAGPEPAGAEPEPAGPLPAERLAEARPDPNLLSDLRLVADRSHAYLEAWPHLLALVNEWWEQPAQHCLAPPPGGIPFSHWLQRWTQAAQALAEPCPRPLLLAGAGEKEAEPQRSSAIGQGQ